MKAPEQALQRQITLYLGWALAPPAWWTSFPAGGGGLMRGRILKGTGLKAGVPDILILFDHHTYWLELKGPRGTVSAVQKMTHEALRRAGSQVATIKSLDEFQALTAGPWWPLQACLRESKPSLELLRQGFNLVPP